MKLTIRGIQEAQRRNLKAIAALKPAGTLGQAVRWGATEAHRQAIPLTPHDTGGLRASHRIRLERDGLLGVVYLDPAAVNPRRRGARPAVYGAHLHRQGMRPGRVSGIRAFYQATAEYKGPYIMARMAEMLRRAI